jgi:hypothetical protein
LSWCGIGIFSTWQGGCQRPIAKVRQRWRIGEIRMLAFTEAKK